MCLQPVPDTDSRASGMQQSDHPGAEVEISIGFKGFQRLLGANLHAVVIGMFKKHFMEA